MAKDNIETVTIRQGWPQYLKQDCEYFEIGFTQLAIKSQINRRRISDLASGNIVFASLNQRLNDLRKLTKAFNGIIEARRRIDVNIQFYEENFFSDNQ